jgi:hypothetical protein
VTFRLDPETYGEFRAKVQFTTAAWMPYRIFQACKKTGILSQTVYCQRAVCEALARDLGMDLDELLQALPRSRNKPRLVNPMKPEAKRNAILLEGLARGPQYVGMGNTDEEVY